MADITERVSVTRPNGKVYTPRKSPVAVEVQDHRGDTEIYVLRTHDVARAHRLATRLGLGDVPATPAELCWIRETFRGGDRVYDHDPVRGCAAVIFEVQ